MKYEFLSKSDLEQIHEATLDILETIGIRSASDRFLDKCAELGLNVKDGTVYIIYRRNRRFSPSVFFVDS